MGWVDQVMRGNKEGARHCLFSADFLFYIKADLVPHYILYLRFIILSERDKERVGEGQRDRKRESVPSRLRIVRS